MGNLLVIRLQLVLKSELFNVQKILKCVNKQKKKISVKNGDFLKQLK